MEPDRYKQHHFWYIAGMLCLLLSLTLFALSAYIFPNLVLGWRYNLPSLIKDFIALLETDYAMPAASDKWVVFAVLDIPAALMFIVADIFSNKIDAEIVADNSANPLALADQQPARPLIGESTRLFLRMLMLAIVVFIVAGFFQWIIS